MDLFIYIGKAATVLSIFYLVYIAILRKDTLFNVNRHFLLGGILAAFIFPFIKINKTILVELSASNDIAYSEFLPIEQGPIQEAIIVDWWEIALFIYGLGVAFMFLRFMKQFISLGLLLYKYPSLKRNGYRYIITSEKTPPFSFFRNIVYNPEFHSQEELEMILKHEEIHAAQWHSIDIIATNLLLVVQWINPLVWFYKRSVEENLEYIADSETVQQIKSVKQYQLALVKASSTSPIPALTNNFYQSFIKKRIVMLNKSTSKKINALKLLLVLPLLAVFLWSFNTNKVITYVDSSESTSEFTNTVSSSEANLFAAESESFNNPVAFSEKSKLAEISENEDKPANNETTAMVKEKKQSSYSELVDQDGIVTITKNTTKSELESMKMSLKSSGISFDYSNLIYNKSKEIIGISISYKSKNGNSGNYSVKSDTPINTIVIKADVEGISVQSTSNRSSSYSGTKSQEIARIRAEEQQQRTERRQQEMENRREEMKLRQQEMKENRGDMIEREREMEERRKAIKDNMEERLAEMHEKRLEVQERQKQMNEHRKVLILEGDSSQGSGKHIFMDDDGSLLEIQDTHEGTTDVIIIDRISENGDGYSERQYRANHSSTLKRITKNSSKNDLENLKTEFDSKGISFSYSGVRRNDAGEITKIKLKVKDNKGSSSSSSYDGGEKTIDPIFIDTTNGITIKKGGTH